jgi:hypothetical protein
MVNGECLFDKAAIRIANEASGAERGASAKSDGIQPSL